uniref:Uncharacterized protein n=1 Tax=Anguilla anguilla TaxID=7936 RepID=A0A0E9VE79_ANGAN
MNTKTVFSSNPGELGQTGVRRVRVAVRLC